MGAGSGFVLGGLLQGLGKGVSDLYEERRQNALANLKRQQDVEDRDAKIAGAKDLAQIQTQGRKEVIELTGDQNRKTEEVKGRQRLEEIKTKGDVDVKIEGVKFENDKQLKRLGAELDIKKDRASQELARDIDGGKVSSIEAADDGTMLVTYKNGTVVPKNVKLREKSSSSDDEEGSISAELNGRKPGSGGGAAQPAAKPAQATNAPKKNEAVRNKAYNALANAYPSATPQTHPSFFNPDGTKKSAAQLRKEIDQATGF